MNKFIQANAESMFIKNFCYTFLVSNDFSEKSKCGCCTNPPMASEFASRKTNCGIGTFMLTNYDSNT